MKGTQTKSNERADPADLKLADFLCFAVYSTNLAFGKVYRPILKKFEASGYLERDKANERQVRVSLTESGRQLRERAMSISLKGACGLTSEEFVKLQKEVVTLRDNLIKAARR